MSETTRRKINLFLTWISWTITISMSAYVVALDVPQTTRWPTFTVIVFIGVAITSSLIRSRYKLTDAIIQAFAAGIKAGREQAQEDERERRGR